MKPAPMKKAANRRQRGFTLLEILIAMTLLGLLMAMLFGGLRLGTRAWEASDVRSADLARLEAVQGFIRRALTGAYPLLGTGDGDAKRQIAFTGGAQAVAFTALMPAHFGVGGFYTITLAVEDGAEDKRLIFRRQLYRPDADGAPPPPAAGDEEKEKVLLEGISKAGFSYFGAADKDETPSWRDEWREMKSLPDLVRLSLTFADKDKRAWPELVIAPRISATTAPTSSRRRRRGQ
ncbi:MAG: prepilin-type N-terminal cleavage/methylation domain-containing protein [Alphaproteobacteria bacterium]|nr:prepilin-type N-terminal cleavage/methylation domain-containing protein [Alphaproteobacteria bacterium]